jgi:hypothetical protein
MARESIGVCVLRWRSVLCNKLEPWFDLIRLSKEGSVAFRNWLRAAYVYNAQPLMERCVVVFMYLASDVCLCRLTFLSVDLLSWRSRF